MPREPFQSILWVRFLIPEEKMKRQWQVRRQFVPHPDGEQRWDRVYQYLLRWAVAAEPESTAMPPFSVLLPQEVDHADCSLRTSIDTTASSTAND